MLIQHFVEDAALLAKSDAVGKPLAGIREAEQRIGNATAYLHALVSRPISADDPPSWDLVRLRLLEIAATAIQAAQQFGLNTERQALDKAIPF